MIKKQVLSILLLTGLFFMFGTGLTAQAAEEWQNVYEAYGINPNDPLAKNLLSEIMIEKPPQAIVIKLDKFVAPSGNPIVPLNEEVIVELGKSAKISTSFEWEDDNFRLAYNVDLTVRYERDKDHETAATLLWASQAYVKGSKDMYVPEAHEHQWIEVIGDTYIREANVAGFLSWDHSSIPLTPKNRSEESSKNLPLNLGEISYKIDRVMVKSGGLSSIINTDASGTTGDTSASVAAAIVIGLLGLAAAAAGAGAAGATAGSSGDEASNDEEAAAYQMVIGKDFGNALKYGQKQRVWARMVELKNGAPVDRPDLTAGISIFSREVLVGASSLRGENVEAEVQIQENAPQEGVISFLYSSEHGTFQNNVRFRLLGKGEIRLASDKVNILSTDAKPFELVYELKNFIEEEPPLELTASSGLVTLEIGKNDKQQTVILITPGHDAEQWDGNAFIKSCKCEITAMDGKLPVTLVFEVNVCFEGIGTAFLNTPHYSTPKEIFIPCDASEGVREDKTFALPLTVMVWKPDARTLEPDTAAIKALSMEVTLMGTSTMKPGSDAFKKFQTMVEEAKIALCETTNTVEIDPKLSPETFGLRATGKTADADIELMLTFTCELPQIAKLTLKAKTSNSMDYKAMIRWLIEYPAGSYASQFIALGDVNAYYRALDHIIGVFQYDKTPNLAKGFRHRSNENYYEHGKGDITRDPYIALHVLPTGIGDLEGVILLHHELTHTLEDILLDERDGTPATGCERSAELLKELARALHNLCNAEKSGGDTIGHIRKAIECLSVGVNHEEVRPWLFETMSTTLPKFGAKYTTLPKELFYHYATDYTGPNTEAIKKAVRRTFCPARLGYYDIVDGLFAGGTMGFSWYHGNLSRVDIECKGFTFDREGRAFEWVPDKEKLIIKVSLTVQKDGMPHKEHVNVSLESNFPYLFNETQYMNISEFSAEWELGVPLGKKFYDPPKESPFYMARKQTSRLKMNS